MTVLIDDDDDEISNAAALVGRTIVFLDKAGRVDKDGEALIIAYEPDRNMHTVEFCASEKRKYVILNKYHYELKTQEQRKAKETSSKMAKNLENEEEKEEEEEEVQRKRNSSNKRARNVENEEEDKKEEEQQQRKRTKTSPKKADIVRKEEKKKEQQQQQITPKRTSPRKGSSTKAKNAEKEEESKVEQEQPKPKKTSRKWSSTRAKNPENREERKEKENEVDQELVDKMEEEDEKMEGSGDEAEEDDEKEGQEVELDDDQTEASKQREKQQKLLAAQRDAVGRKIRFMMSETNKSFTYGKIVGFDQDKGTHSIQIGKTKRVVELDLQDKATDWKYTDLVDPTGNEFMSIATSKYAGVARTSDNLWGAYKDSVSLYGSRIGTFKSEKDAALAHDFYARKMNRKDINFKKEKLSEQEIKKRMSKDYEPSKDETRSPHRKRRVQYNADNDQSVAEVPDGMDDGTDDDQSEGQEMDSKTNNQQDEANEDPDEDDSNTEDGKPGVQEKGSKKSNRREGAGEGPGDDASDKLDKTPKGKRKSKVSQKRNSNEKPKGKGKGKMAQKDISNQKRKGKANGITSQKDDRNEKPKGKRKINGAMSPKDNHGENTKRKGKAKGKTSQKDESQEELTGKTKGGASQKDDEIVASDESEDEESHAEFKYRLGTRFMKEFKGYGRFEGRVVGIHGGKYRVLYPRDGDMEDIQESDMDKLSIMKTEKKHSNHGDKPKGAKYAIGTRFIKKFEGYGMFEGEIKNFTGQHYKVFYPADGDSEELTEHELEKLEFL